MTSWEDQFITPPQKPEVVTLVDILKSMNAGIASILSVQQRILDGIAGIANAQLALSEHFSCD